MKKTVLVVEDDFDTQHPLAEILQLKGYSVATASDVERAFSAMFGRLEKMEVAEEATQIVTHTRLSCHVKCDCIPGPPVLL